MLASPAAVTRTRRGGRRSYRRGGPWRRLGTVAALLVLLWCAGFGWFVHRILRPTAPPGHAGGIVVLTGGAGRMREAFLLLLAGHAPRLLVSGVAADTSLAEIAELAGISEASLGGRVALGRHAASTRGNAREAAAWTAARHLRSLILVTSFYHMPRALSEFRAALPRVRLIPVSVAPRAPVFAWPAGLWRVVAAEYCKWLATKAGLVGPVQWLERRGA